MKFKILGTAAAEGVPSIYCKCEACETARRLKGKNIRTRSQGLINDDLIIDYPPDTYMHFVTQDINPHSIKNIIFTHSHEDHFFPPDMYYRCAGFCPVREPHKINVYSNRTVYDLLYRTLDYIHLKDAFDDVMTCHIIEPFKEYRIGEYRVCPMLADHKYDETCLIYLITDKAGKTVLYGNDTGNFPEETWKFIEKKHLYLNLVSLDCCFGWLESDSNHMGIKCCKQVKDRLISIGCADGETKFVITHFSHNGLHGGHNELQQLASEYGFTAAYDGIEFEI